MNPRRAHEQLGWPANLPAKPPPPSAFRLRRHRVSRGAHNIYARGCIGRPQRAAAAVRRSADQASRPSAMPFYTDGLPCSHRRVPWDQYCKSGCLGEFFAVPRAAPLLSPLPSRGLSLPSPENLPAPIPRGGGGMAMQVRKYSTIGSEALLTRWPSGGPLAGRRWRWPRGAWWGGCA